MDITKNLEYIKLSEDDLKARQGYHIAKQKLRDGYFLEVDKKVAEIEERTKLNFVKLLDKNLKDYFLDFRFVYDPAHFLFVGEIKNMMISRVYYDLGFHASKFPEWEREHCYMEATSKDYRETYSDIEKSLIEKGFHPSSRPVKVKDSLEKFFLENRIQGIIPKVF